MAICTFVSSARRFSSRSFPIDDTVMRFGLHARPHGAVSISMAFSTASRLSIGSPMPMNTRLVSRSLPGTDSTWLIMPVVVRLPWNPWRPVIQNWQFMRQPAWELTQRVARSASGMNTASMSRPPTPSNRYLAVPSTDMLSAVGASARRCIARSGVDARPLICPSFHLYCEYGLYKASGPSVLLRMGEGRIQPLPDGVRQVSSRLEV